MKAIRNRGRLDPRLEALGGVAVAGVVAFAYWRIASGVSTVGDFMGFITALLMAAQPIRAIGNLSGRVQEGLAAAESIYAIRDEKPRIAEAPDARPLAIGAGAISFDKVGFTYEASGAVSGPTTSEAQGATAEAHGATAALRDFTLAVPRGRTVARICPAGAGR